MMEFIGVFAVTFTLVFIWLLLEAKRKVADLCEIINPSSLKPGD